MIDWNMGQPAESFESGRKMPIPGVIMPDDAPVQVTAIRTRVGQPSTSQAREALFQTTVTTALNGVAKIEAETRRVARAFRGHDVAQAHRDFETLIDTISTLTILTAGLGHAAAQDDERASEYCASPSVCAVLGSVSSAVESLIERNSARDWRGMADSLESELAPALARWASVFGAIGARCVA